MEVEAICVADLDLEFSHGSKAEIVSHCASCDGPKAVGAASLSRELESEDLDSDSSLVAALKIPLSDKTSSVHSNSDPGVSSCLEDKVVVANSVESGMTLALAHSSSPQNADSDSESHDGFAVDESASDPGAMDTDGPGSVKSVYVSSAQLKPSWQHHPSSDDSAVGVGSDDFIMAGNDDLLAVEHSADFNQDDVREHAGYISKYKALVCKHCKAAVSPVDVRKHARNVHSNLNPETLSELVVQLVNLASKHSALHPAELAVPLPAQLRVPVLDVCRGFKCTGCSAVFVSKTRFHRQEYHLDSSCLCTVDTMVPVEAAQRWTRFCRMFEVESGCVKSVHNPSDYDDALDVAARERDSGLLSMLNESVKNIRDLFASDVESVVRASNGAVQPSNWAEMHQWHQLLSGCDLRLISSLAQQPERKATRTSDAEMSLVLKEDLFVKFLLEAHVEAKAAPDVVRYALNHDRPDKEAAGRRKFGIMDKTARDYAVPFVGLIRIFLRAYRLEPEELAKIPAVRIAFGKHKERIERLVNAEALSQLRTEFFQFCVALLTEFDGGARKPCAAKIAVACLGVDPSRNLAWCEPWNFSKPLSGLIYHFRSVGYFCLKKAHVTVAGVAQSSGNRSLMGDQDDAANALAPYDDDNELEKLVIDFMEFRSKFLVLSASHVCDYFHRARAYCLKTKNPSISQFHADTEGFHFAGKHIFYNSFKPVARAMVEELLEDYLKISLNKEMGTKPWSVDVSALKDNLWDSTNGFSFVSQPGNCNAVGAGSDLKKRALRYFFDESKLSNERLAAEIGQTFPRGLKMETAVDWLSDVRQFKKSLATCIMFTAGASNRATELLAALVQNDTDWPRTVRLFNGRVFLQQGYSKSMAKRESVVLHFLPKAVGQILVDWLVQGHPLHMMIETVVFQQECPPLLFWAKGGVVKPDDLSQDMSLKTAAYGLGAATGIRMFRQVQAFVIRAKLGSREAMQLGSAGPDTNEEENDGLAYEAELLHELESTEQLSQVGVALTLQAGHSVKTALKYYGLTQEDVVGVNESVMGAFLAASNKWHEFLGLGDDSLMSKDADGDDEAIVVVSAKNFESLKVKAYPDKDHLREPSCIVHAVLKTGPVPSSVMTALRSIHSGKDIVLRANGGQAKAIFFASTSSSSTPKHLLAALPTGTGKTEIWLGPLKAERQCGKPLCVLFLTPFVALGKDIVRRVEKAGLEAQYVSHTSLNLVTMSTAVIVMTVDAALNAECIKYALTLIKSSRLQRLVIDEAHVALFDSWRTIFQDVNSLGQLAAKVPFLLTTATLPPKQEATLGAIYGLQQLHVVRAPVQRANVRLEVRKVHGGQAGIKAHVQILVRGVLDCGQSVMVFVTSRKDAVLWAETLNCGYYVSKDGQGDEILDNHLRNFLNGRLKIIVGTTALCAGVDCPDVRLVLHIGHPFSLTQWVQAAGRAGRDGSEACAQIVLHHDGQSQSAEEPYEGIFFKDDAVSSDGDAMRHEHGQDAGCDVCDPVNHWEPSLLVHLEVCSRTIAGEDSKIQDLCLATEESAPPASFIVTAESRNKGKTPAFSSEDQISSCGPFDLSRPGPPVSPHQVGVKLFRSQPEISGVGTLLPSPQFNHSLGQKRPRVFLEANDMREEEATRASQVEEEFIPATSLDSDFAVPPKHLMFSMGNQSGDRLFPRLNSVTAPEASRLNSVEMGSASDGVGGHGIAAPGTYPPFDLSSLVGASPLPASAVGSGALPSFGETGSRFDFSPISSNIQRSIPATESGFVKQRQAPAAAPPQVGVIGNPQMKARTILCIQQAYQAHKADCGICLALGVAPGPARMHKGWGSCPNSDATKGSNVWAKFDDSASCYFCYLPQDVCGGQGVKGNCRFQSKFFILDILKVLATHRHALDRARQLTTSTNALPGMNQLHILNPEKTGSAPASWFKLMRWNGLQVYPAFVVVAAVMFAP
ncbi:hypothetical protein DFJ73DRAFT_925648 [Zopfochytrium polystomum]|nr:hypothetical protein DFJ73DRAFT_925648 [Zopfochytrium polystomum]